MILTPADSGGPACPADWAAFQATMGELMAVYCPMADPEQAAALRSAWARVLGSAGPWLTPALLAEALAWTLRHVEGFLPTPGEFVRWAAGLRRQQEAEAEILQVALPTPDVAVETDAAAARHIGWSRQVAYGKALQRRRFGLMAAWRAAALDQDPHAPRYFPVPAAVWRGKDEPSEEEVAAALAELTAAETTRGERRQRGGEAVPPLLAEEAFRLGTALLGGRGQTRPSRSGRAGRRR